MSDIYYWSHLRRGNQHTVGYIEERAAVVGKHVEMLDYNNERWEVMTVDDTPVTKAFVRANEKNYKQFQKSLKGGGIDSK